MSVTSRITALDGLRGIAILSVLVYHFSIVPIESSNWIDLAYYRLAHYGWIGVDIFFVLSGFLITRNLIDLKSRARSLREALKVFYARRTLRIFPVYYGYLALYFLVVPFTLWKFIPTEQADFVRGATWSYWLYVSNIYEFVTNGMSHSGLGHFWSLAIEEQYYLVWAPVVLILSVTAVGWIAMLGALGALALRLLFWADGFTAHQIGVFTLTHCDGLLLGSLAAIQESWLAATRARSGWVGPVLLLGTVALFCSLGSSFDYHPFVHTVGLSLVAISAYLIVRTLIQTQGRQTVWRGWLESPVLAFFGKYSYAMYVVHVIIRAGLIRLFPEPILVLGSQLVWQAVFLFVGSVLTIAVSLASWHLLEAPCLKLKSRFRV